MCLNSIGEHRRLISNHWQPFAILVEIPLVHKKETAVFHKKNGRFENWLPLVDALRNQLSNASKEVISTILIAQNQVKDGFLEANTQYR